MWSFHQIMSSWNIVDELNSHDVLTEYKPVHNMSSMSLILLRVKGAL